jgi:hypothetical protein
MDAKSSVRPRMVRKRRESACHKPSDIIATPSMPSLPKFTVPEH